LAGPGASSPSRNLRLEAIADAKLADVESAPVAGRARRLQPPTVPACGIGREDPSLDRGVKDVGEQHERLVDALVAHHHAPLAALVSERVAGGRGRRDPASRSIHLVLAVAVDESDIDLGARVVGEERQQCLHSRHS
jgi:hypothetical protein